MVALTIWHLWHPVGIIAEAHDGPVRGWGRSWLWITAVFTALWGVALFLTDAGPSNLVWVWPGDLLTSRLIAVMLWTLTAAAVYSLRSAEALRVMLAVMITYGIGVVVANLWNPAAIKPLYTLSFALLAVGSLVILWRSGRS